MLRPVLTIMFVLFYQYAICYPYQHIEEKTAALNKFKRLGVNVANVKLSVVEDVGELCILEDAINNKFAIVAKSKYRTVLDDLVLAYSTDSRFQGTESAWKKNLLSFYSNELTCLKLNNANKQTYNGIHFEKINPIEVTPLLSTKWGQGYPYNLLCPKTILSISNKLTGCVATAMSQVMYYHKYPQKGEGHLNVNVDGRVEKVDFSLEHPQWKQMKLSYSPFPKSGENITPVAKLMFVNALSISSSFGDTGTAANNLAARTALVNFWHYHPTCQLIKSENQDRLIPVIVNNLKRKLPVIISGGAHSFICDGIKGDYLHFNLGWGGAANGYYKVKIGGSHQGNNKFTLIKEVLHNIQPDNGDIYDKHVRVEKPGTLKLYLTEQEKRSLRKLSVSGCIGGEDIALLRQMSGALDMWDSETNNSYIDTSWTGSLQVLDIEDVIIKKDEIHPYYYMKANGSSFKDYKKEYVFDKNMDGEQFSRFKRTSMSHGIGYRYSQRDTIFYIEFFTEDNTISPMMFYNCQNLKEIKLPLSTKRIMGKAFGWCNSLKQIRIPYNTMSIESGAFEDCYLLEDVVVSKIPRETCHNLSPIKVDGKYGDKANGCHLGLFNKNSTLRCKGIIMNGKIIESIPYKKKF